ncbi:unnamed protein product [Penicillium pancosmium]
MDKAVHLSARIEQAVKTVQPPPVIGKRRHRRGFQRRTKPRWDGNRRREKAATKLDVPLSEARVQLIL